MYVLHFGPNNVTESNRKAKSWRQMEFPDNISMSALPAVRVAAAEGDLDVVLLNYERKKN